MKKTAIEWLIEEIHKNMDFIPVHIQEQAKELEKQQIVDAYRVGKVEASLPPEKLNTGGKYYRELFKPE
jgi:hypothetical protein